MRNVCSERTASLCSGISFNGLVGRLNDEIIMLDVPVIEPNELTNVRYIKYYANYKFGEVDYRESVAALKQLAPTPFDKRLLLSHELKVLTYIGCHDSIVYPLGISEIQNEPVSIFAHVSTTDLDSYRRWIEFDQIRWIIKNISSALQFLQTKCVLLNNLTE